MDWGPILIAVLPAILTFLIGLFRNKPGYLKSKNVMDMINRHIADDKIDSTEVEEWADLFKKEPAE
jgi:hypothetical protein